MTDTGQLILGSNYSFYGIDFAFKEVKHVVQKCTKYLV